MVTLSENVLSGAWNCVVLVKFLYCTCTTVLFPLLVEYNTVADDILLCNI